MFRLVFFLQPEFYGGKSAKETVYSEAMERKVGQYVKIFPESFKNWPCMKVELYGESYISKYQDETNRAKLTYLSARMSLTYISARIGSTKVGTLIGLRQGSSRISLALVNTRLNLTDTSTRTSFAYVEFQISFTASHNYLSARMSAS